MSHASHSHIVMKTFALLGGLLFVASVYGAVMYYPLHQMCTFCVTRVR
jgi:hypothetical protein